MNAATLEHEWVLSHWTASFGMVSVVLHCLYNKNLEQSTYSHNTFLQVKWIRSHIAEKLLIYNEEKLHGRILFMRTHTLVFYLLFKVIFKQKFRPLPTVPLYHKCIELFSSVPCQPQSELLILRAHKDNNKSSKFQVLNSKPPSPWIPLLILSAVHWILTHS